MYKPNCTQEHPRRTGIQQNILYSRSLTFSAYACSMISERYVVFCSACVQLHQRLFDRKTTCDFYSPTIHLAAHPTTHRKSDTRASITDKQTSHYALPGEKKTLQKQIPNDYTTNHSIMTHVFISERAKLGLEDFIRKTKCQAIHYQS